MEEILELLNAGQYTKLRQLIVELNVADIAAYMEEMEKDDLLKLFRILPKNMAADVFSYLEIETEQYIITSLSDRDAAHIIDNLMADDATDLLEEMPANVVKRLLSNTTKETRRDINNLLKYEDDSAGSIMTVEFIDLKENYKETIITWSCLVIVLVLFYINSVLSLSFACLGALLLSVVLNKELIQQVWKSVALKRIKK